MKTQSLVNTLLMIVLDCLFCWLSWMASIFVFTYLFKNDSSLISVTNSQFYVLVAACAAWYLVTGVYRSLWQHPGIGSVLRLALAVLLTSFSVYVSLRVRLGFWSNPGLGMMAFYFLLTLSLFVRMYRRVTQTVAQYLRRYLKIGSQDIPYEPIRTLIVGAGESASAFIVNPSQHGTRPRRILGIVDNDARKHGYSLHGVYIFGDDGSIPELCKRLDIDEIIVAIPTMKNEDLRRIVRLAPTNRVKVRVFSALSTDKAGERLRDLNIGDLLGRPEAELNTSGISDWLRGKVILVTGGGGSIGGEICRQLLKFDVEKIVIFDISENNAYNLKTEFEAVHGQKARYKVAVRIGSVQDEQRLEEVFAEFRPSIVFHAAAYKHVPLMEQCPRLAVENNVYGTWRAAACALRHGVQRFVMISTDKAVNPTNVMGATKRLAELIVTGLNNRGPTEFVCVRFGNVLDSNGSVIPLFKRQIEAGGPVTVTDPKIIRYFMTISEAARLVIDAGAMAAGGEIFILDMGEPVKIMDLAENLIRMAGLIPGVDVRIEIIGLRPGEKLYEELLLNEEGLTRTLNDKIFVAKPESEAEAEDIIKYMEEAARRGADVRAAIRRYVPEYLERS